MKKTLILLTLALLTAGTAWWLLRDHGESPPGEVVDADPGPDAVDRTAADGPEDALGDASDPYPEPELRPYPAVTNIVLGDDGLPYTVHPEVTAAVDPATPYQERVDLLRGLHRNPVALAETPDREAVWWLLANEAERATVWHEAASLARALDPERALPAIAEKALASTRIKFGIYATQHVGLLAREDGAVQEKALETLRYLASGTEIPSAIKNEALLALVEVGDPSGQPLAQAALDDEQRAAVALRCGLLAGLTNDALVAARAYLDDDRFEVQLAALRVLEVAGEEEDLVRIADLMQAEHRLVREKAEGILAAVED